MSAIGVDSLHRSISHKSIGWGLSRSGHTHQVANDFDCEKANEISGRNIALGITRTV